MEEPTEAPEDGKERASESSGLAPLILRWDLDKTYLATEFESLRAMLRIPFEAAADKRSLPGVRTLIRALQSEARWAGRKVETCFITASPPQIRGPIEEKLRSDGIQVDDIVYKDQVRALLRGRFRSLRQHVGYKLEAMLRHRRDRAPAGARELLFGDDWEMDPLVYTLYADLIAGSIDRESARALLHLLRLSDQRIARLLELAAEAAVGEPVVDAILIHRARPGLPTGRLGKYGDRLTGTGSYLQTAVVLHHRGYLGERSVAAVADSLIEDEGWTREMVRAELEALGRRGRAELAEAAALAARNPSLFDPGDPAEPPLAASFPRPPSAVRALQLAPAELVPLEPERARRAARRLAARWLDRLALRLARRRRGWLELAARRPQPADYSAILVELINGTAEYGSEEAGAD